MRIKQGLPRSGGEKNYLEFIFRRPKFLVSCVFAMYAVLIVSVGNPLGVRCSSPLVLRIVVL